MISTIAIIWIDPLILRIFQSDRTTEALHRNLLSSATITIVTILVAVISWRRGGIAPIPTSTTSMALFAIGVYVIGIGNIAVIVASLVAAIQHLSLPTAWAMIFAWMFGAVIGSFGIILIEISRLTNRV